MFRARLTIGQEGPLYVRHEYFSNPAEAYRVAYVSDIHLRSGRSRILCQQVLDSLRRSEPHVVLLGGDMIDSMSELGALTELIQKTCSMAPVLAIGGNHDDQVGIEGVRCAVADGGGQWIHQSSVAIRNDSRVVTISGPAAKDRLAGDFQILCAHNPRIWKTSRDCGFDVVLAGHLHGCQVVAFEYGDRLYPGAFFYPYCYLSHQRGATRLVVSRGVSDLVPIRWRCPREIVLCHV